MATQTKRTTGSSTDADGTTVAQAGATTFAEISRQQMAATAEAMGAWFRSIETMQQAQLHMGQRAALLHSQAAENIRKATSPMELASIQTTLMVYEFQEMVRYWQELSTAAARAGGEALRPAQQQDGLGATSPAATMVGAAMNAAAPMAEAFQQMFTAPMKAATAQQAAAH